MLLFIAVLTGNTMIEGGAECEDAADKIPLSAIRHIAINLAKEEEQAI